MVESNCTVEGCAKRAWARGWCKGHLHRFYNYGDPLGAPAPRPSFSERLWALVDKHGPVSEYRPDLGACWIWRGKPDAHGYGTLRLPYADGGKTVKAHRATYEALVGPIPEGLVIDHLCRVHECVNPAHLEPVTQLVNHLRGDRIAPTHCPRGHAYTTENTRIVRGGRSRTCRTCERGRT